MIESKACEKNGEIGTWTLGNIPHSNWCGGTLWSAKFTTILMVHIHCKHPSSNCNILIAEHPETVIRYRHYVHYKTRSLKIWKLILINKRQLSQDNGEMEHACYS